ncbi:MAG: flagellar hook-associated protein FlgK [candidate division Zixibacteria bacterium]|nr:flagellar hook-associated protein FlgK [candidate division Zixibacteria bacterium]
MYGLSNTLELGKRALMSQQLAMSTTGHNIANVNTPGYSRQRVEITSSYPVSLPQGIMGTGVMVGNITHIRDIFLTAQYRRENGHLQRWTMTHKSLSRIESFLNEPGETGLNQLLNDFFNAWENLTAYPDARTAVIEKAKVLVNALHEQAAQLADMKRSINQEISNCTEQINVLASQIAATNRQIISSELGGQKANDLRDRRDYLIDELSTLTEVRTIHKENGSVTALLGSMSLVDGADYLRIVTETESSGSDIVSVAYWENTRFSIEFTGGQLLVLQEFRDRLIPEYQQGLDNLAETLITQVNTIHAAGIGADGSTGVNFFDPLQTKAMTITINVEIDSNVNLIAASLSGEPGDIRNAQAIGDLRHSRVMMSDSMTMNEFYADMVASLGIKVQESSNLKVNYELLVTQVENARESIQGVSIDEEMANLVKYQRAYEAAARIIT